LFGGVGNDEFIGGPGADLHEGEGDRDRTNYASSPAGVTVDLMTRVGTGGDADGDAYRSIEDVLGSAFGDQITGDENANDLSGLDGVDTIRGGGGADQIVGGLRGDRLSGEAGADMFFYRSIDDSQVGSSDDIFDFNRAEGDRILLSDIDANVNVGGDQAFTFIGAGPFTGVAGQLYYNGYLEGDVNGDAVPDFRIVLAQAFMQSSDFVL
jgi:Ca2+-binding RTX toxin-like protein